MAVVSENTAGNITSFINDALGRTTVIQLPTGQLATYGFDGMSRRLTRHEPGGALTSLAWWDGELIEETS